MVRNHSEIKRGKTRMVINYKRLNEQFQFDGHLFPEKMSLSTKPKG